MYFNQKAADGLTEQCNGSDSNESDCCNAAKKDVKTFRWTSEKKFDSSSRCTTDKYWCSLFIVAFPVWILSWLYVVLHRTESKISTENSIRVKVDYQFPCFCGKFWILDTITCNMAFLNIHYENNGSIVIWTNVLFCSFLIMYSLSSMRIDEIFYYQLAIANVVLMPFAIGHRLMVCLNHYVRNWSSIPLYMQPLFHEKLRFWLMPELMFLMILYIKRSYATNSEKKIKDELIPFEYFKVHTVAIITIFSVFILPFPIISTIDILNELNNDCLLYYVIATGSSCYIVLTIFYFGLMVISCTIDMSIDKDSIICDDLSFLVKAPLRAFITVGRYHFGTACYHATLIFPRLETLFISINDGEIKKIREYSKFTDRLYVTQVKLHNLSLATTAMRGSNHCDSIKKLMLNFSSDLPKLEYFQTHSQIARSLLALLTSANGLIFILLWVYGVHDPYFMFSTWAFYLYIMLIVTAFMKSFDVAWDTVMFYIDHHHVVHKNTTLVFCGNSLI